jgi:hypothetical protein
MLPCGGECRVPVLPSDSTLFPETEIHSSLKVDLSDSHFSKPLNVFIGLQLPIRLQHSQAGGN